LRLGRGFFEKKTFAEEGSDRGDWVLGGRGSCQACGENRDFSVEFRGKGGALREELRKGGERLFACLEGRGKDVRKKS